MGFVDEGTGRPLVAAFEAALPSLYGRGFPRPDPDTGRFDLDAIAAWRRTRHSHLFPIAPTLGARNAASVVPERLERLRCPK